MQTDDERMGEEQSIDEIIAKMPSLAQMRESQERFANKRRFDDKPNPAPESEEKYWENVWATKSPVDEAYGRLAGQLRRKHHETMNLDLRDAKRLVWDIIKSLCPEYKVTDDNKYLLNQFTLYFLRNHECEYNLDKGIYLYGNTGRGKTLLMTTFQMFTMSIKYRQFRTVSCLAIAQDVLTNGGQVMDKYVNGSFCFDDLGHEKIQYYYKTEVDVMEQILARSERHKEIIHVTSNLLPDQLLDRYGERIYSRSKALFNFVELKGTNDFREP